MSPTLKAFHLFFLAVLFIAFKKREENLQVLRDTAKQSPSFYFVIVFSHSSGCKCSPRKKKRRPRSTAPPRRLFCARPLPLPPLPLPPPLRPGLLPLVIHSQRLLFFSFRGSARAAGATRSPRPGASVSARPRTTARRPAGAPPGCRSRIRRSRRLGQGPSRSRRARRGAG